MAKRLRITLVRSPIGYAHDQKDTVRRLGLRKMWHAVEHDDSPGIRGMVHKVRHLVRVEELESAPAGEVGSQTDTTPENRDGEGRHADS